MGRIEARRLKRRPLASRSIPLLKTKIADFPRLLHSITNLAKGVPIALLPFPFFRLILGLVRERHQRPRAKDLGNKCKIFYWDYSSGKRCARTKSWAKSKFPTWAEAQREADQFIEDVNERNNQPQPFPFGQGTLAALVEMCRKRIWPLLKNSTRISYDYFLDTHILTKWGSVKLTKMRAIEFISGRRGFSLGGAVLLPGERHRERVVAQEEEARYLAAAPEPLASIATALADTGMRPDECYRLRWVHIPGHVDKDSEAMWIRIPGMWIKIPGM
jgi:integrase